MASISDKVALKRLEDKGLKGFKKHIPIRNQSLCKRCGKDRVDKKDIDAITDIILKR